MQAGSSNQRSVQSEINVTPLVDVVLVLLIIFMVVTPMLQKGMDVLLPITDNPDKKQDNPNELIIAIKDDGSLYIETDLVSKTQFVSIMKETYERSPGKEIMLKGDTRLKYKDVKKVMEMLSETGFDRVYLVTEKTPQPG